MMFGLPIPAAETPTAADVFAHAAAVHQRRIQRELMAKRTARLERMVTHVAAVKEVAPPPAKRDWIFVASGNGQLAVQPTFATPETRLSRVRSSKHAKRIIAWVCRRLKIGADELLSNRRCRSIVRPRHLAIQLVAHSRHCEALSLPDIGRLFGGRDHTTILHAARKAPSYQLRYSNAPYIKRRPVLTSGAA